LLLGFGGHPLAAGLSLRADRIDLFREGINQQLAQRYGSRSRVAIAPSADLTVTVADLGQALFRELKCLEPFGMGNPTPRLWLRRGRISNARHQNIRDLSGKKVSYICTTFMVWDETVDEGFPGVWWGHYQDELIENNPLDLLVELDFNRRERGYHVRLIKWQLPVSENDNFVISDTENYLVDCRDRDRSEIVLPRSPELSSSDEVFALDRCPQRLDDLFTACRLALAQNKKLALAYGVSVPSDIDELWQQLVGQVKYLSRTGRAIAQTAWQQHWGMGDATLALVLVALGDLGFEVQYGDDGITFTTIKAASDTIAPDSIDNRFIQQASIERSYRQAIAAWQEDRFIQQFFKTVPVEVLDKILRANLSANKPTSAP
jgi:single-stranded-DNA-specific exonuclease